MLAYMNAESLALTLESGETWFWSRTRQELWHKGATTGNVQRVRRTAGRLRRRRACCRSSSRPAPPATRASTRCFFRDIRSMAATAQR